MSYIRWFQEIGAADLALVGGKGANLGEMVAAGLPVPPGFCLTAAAYRDFVRVNGLYQVIRGILARTALDDPDDVRAKAAHIRGLFAGQPVPAALSRAIVAGYRPLGQVLGEADPAQTPVAVRSSATAEDLPVASFAGQQDTYLNVRGEEELLERVKDCWASLWTDRAILYRTRQGFDHRGVELAVVVQAMIPAQVSGVLFTADPVSGDRERAVVNASWGLGEAIVAGLVTPDTFTVRKDDGEVVSRQIASKERLVDYARDGGTVELETAPERQGVPALADDQVRALVAVGNEIEARYGVPQDIEWAYAGERFYIVQTRPITTLGEPTTASEEAIAPDAGVGIGYNRSMLVELFPDPVTPSFLSVIEHLIPSMYDFTLRSLGFELPEGIDAVRVFYNQPYFNADYIAAALEPLSPRVRERLVAQIVDPWGRDEEDLQIELSPPFLRMVIRVVNYIARLRRRQPGLIARHRADVAGLAALSLEEISEAEAVAQAKGVLLGSTRRLLDFDFLLIAVIGSTYRLLSRLLGRYFGEEAEQLRGKLISGLTGNLAMESNQRLWDLAGVARASPAVSERLREGGEGDLLAELKGMPEGREFVEALERFLGEYGHREIRLDILYPTWGEDPAPVLGFVRSYLDAGEEQSPYQRQARLVEERQAATRLALARVGEGLAGRLVAAPMLRWLLHHTQANTRERDTAHFELTRVFPPIRSLMLELGRRWAERDLFESTEDIFFLRLEEIEELASSPRPLHDVVRERRAEFEANRARPWPDIIRGDREIYLRDAAARGVMEGLLQGIASSPGLASGVARVIRGPAEFSKLQKDDILVAPLTNPVWTPLFAIAGGVVTEVGGMLSHGAIVAREYGIPAVMSVPGVTTRVQEGQRITVDGDRGTVRLEPEG